MRSTIFIVLAFLWSVPSMAQGTDRQLLSELQAQHAQWFKAFDNGDGATMDQMEMDNLVLVLPMGSLFSKTEPRAGKQKKVDPQTERTLSDVALRRFGETAILTGILTSTTGTDSNKDATTVVFVQTLGKWKIASAQWTPVTNNK